MQPSRWEEHIVEVNRLQAEYGTLTVVWWRLQLARGGVLIAAISAFWVLFATYRTYLIASRSAPLFDNVLLVALPYVILVLVHITRWAETSINSMIRIVRTRGIVVENILGIQEGVFVAARQEDNIDEGQIQSVLNFTVESAAGILRIVCVLLAALALMAALKLVW